MKNSKQSNAKNKIPASKAHVMKKPLEIIAMRDFSTDPNGSYTGVCENIHETPVQDADDL